MAKSIVSWVVNGKLYQEELDDGEGTPYVESEVVDHYKEVING